MADNSHTIRLSGSYDICAAHQLYREDWTADKNKEVFGHCANVHGHQYRLEIIVEGSIHPETGMLINGYDMDGIVKECIMNRIDHKFLNKDEPFFADHLPTAEWIAVWAFQTLKPAFPKHVKLARVRIYETPSLYAEYCGSN